MFKFSNEVMTAIKVVINLRGLVNIIKPRIGAGTWPNKTRLVVSFTFAAKPGRKS